MPLLFSDVCGQFFAEDDERISSELALPGASEELPQFRVLGQQLLHKMAQVRELHACGKHIFLFGVEVELNFLFEDGCDLGLPIFGTQVTALICTIDTNTQCQRMLMLAGKGDKTLIA